MAFGTDTRTITRTPLLSQGTGVNMAFEASGAVYEGTTVQFNASGVCTLATNASKWYGIVVAGNVSTSSDGTVQTAWADNELTKPVTVRMPFLAVIEVPAANVAGGTTVGSLKCRRIYHRTIRNGNSVTHHCKQSRFFNRAVRNFYHTCYCLKSL
jgi:hypothetical protein